MTFYTHKNTCEMIRYSKPNLYSVQKEMQSMENARLLVFYNCSTCWSVCCAHKCTWPSCYWTLFWCLIWYASNLCRILTCKSSSVWEWSEYTAFFKNPCKSKSGKVRSGDPVGHNSLHIDCPSDMASKQSNLLQFTNKHAFLMVCISFWTPCT